MGNSLTWKLRSAICTAKVHSLNVFWDNPSAVLADISEKGDCRASSLWGKRSFWSRYRYGILNRRGKEWIKQADLIRKIREKVENRIPFVLPYSLSCSWLLEWWDSLRSKHDRVYSCLYSRSNSRYQYCYWYQTLDSIDWGLSAIRRWNWNLTGSWLERTISYLLSPQYHTINDISKREKEATNEDNGHRRL